MATFPMTRLRCAACGREFTARMFGGHDRPFGSACERCRRSVPTFKSFGQLRVAAERGDVLAQLLIIAGAENLGVSMRGRRGERRAVALDLLRQVLSWGPSDINGASEQDLLHEFNFVRDCL